jgi:hypothetical protein
MKTIGWVALVCLALIAGYSFGVVRATRKAIREDRTGPALFAIAAANALEAKDTAKAAKVDALRLRRAIEDTAALGEIAWARVILESTSDIDGYSQFMGTIAAFVAKHPEVAIASPARAYISTFLKPARRF